MPWRRGLWRDWDMRRAAIAPCRQRRNSTTATRQGRAPGGSSTSTRRNSLPSSGTAIAISDAPYMQRPTLLRRSARQVVSTFAATVLAHSYVDQGDVEQACDVALHGMR